MNVNYTGRQRKKKNAFLRNKYVNYIDLTFLNLIMQPKLLQHVPLLETVFYT